MILDVLLFPVFLGVLYAIGAGMLRIAHGQSFSPGLYPHWFIFTTALLAIGFLSVIFNFFTGVASPLFYAILALLFIIGAWQLRGLKAADVAECILLGLILAPFAANMPWGPDAGLYHLPHQLWIRDEKIVFGVANFSSAFGFSSFSEYVLAPLWIHEQFKLLSYTTATYFLILLLFLSRMARLPGAPAAALGVLTLIALIINSKYFVIGYTSTDTPCGIFFAIAFFCGFQLLSEDSPVQKKHLSMFFLCVVLSFFYKASGITLFVWALFVILRLLQEKRITWGILIPASVLPALLMLIWLVRGVIVTGCVLYMVPSTCLNVPWVAKTWAIASISWVTAWARNPAAGLQSLQGWSWLSDWWLAHWPFCLYEICTLCLVAGAYGYGCRKKLHPRRDMVLPALVFILLCLAVWFIKSPDPRFGIGVFIILPAVVALAIFGVQQMPPPKHIHLDKLCRFIEPKAVTPALAGLLVILLAAKLVIVDAAGGRNRNYLHFTMLSVGSVPTQPNPYFGVMPVPLESRICWLAKYCSPNYNVHDTIHEKYGYQYFHE